MQSLTLMGQAWDMLSCFIAVTTPVSFQPHPRADPCHLAATLAPTPVCPCLLNRSCDLLSWWSAISEYHRLDHLRQDGPSVGVWLSQSSRGWATYKQLKVL